MPETNNPETTVHGDTKHGFIVEVHDGDRFETFGIDAKNEKDATAEALRRFNPPAEKKGKA